MKRIILILLAVLIALPAFADVDLSGLTFEELAQLRDRCQMEMMAREEWQEVLVPDGVYEVGKDIPAGHWTVRLPDNNTMGYVGVIHCDRLDETGTEVDYMNATFMVSKMLMPAGKEPGVHETDILAKDGEYIMIVSGSVIFTPYTGRNLGFK